MGVRCGGRWTSGMHSREKSLGVERGTWVAIERWHYYTRNITSAHV